MQEHQNVIDYITAINARNNVHIGILADLQGPKLRIGKNWNGSMDIVPGDILTFTNEECLGTKERYTCRTTSLPPMWM